MARGGGRSGTLVLRLVLACALTLSAGCLSRDEPPAWNGETPSLSLTLGEADVVLFPYDVDETMPAWPPTSSKQRIAADGALETDYEARYPGAGWQFSPVAAAQYCYQMHNALAIQGEPIYREAVLSLANGLLKRAERTAQGILWRYQFPQPTFGADKGWISGMAQGLAIACFGAAYSLTGEKKFQQGAADALGVLVADFGDNGTAVELGDGLYYEEVAGAGSEPSHILNGMVYALMGLWFYNEIDPSPPVQKALNAGIRGVQAALPEYDAPGVSLYDLEFRRLARVGKDYNVVHVAQLQWLHEITGEAAYGRAALRFMQHERSPVFTGSASSQRPERPIENVDGSKSYFVAAEGGPVMVHLTFDEPRIVDRLMLIGYSDSTRAGHVQLKAGDFSMEQNVTSRFSEFDFAPQEVEVVEITLTPHKRGSRVALALLAVNGPGDRRLTAVSSDTRSYRDSEVSTQRAKRTPPSGSPLNVSDGDVETVWTTDARDPWLLVHLGDRDLSGLSLRTCPGAPLPVEVTYSPDLEDWSTVEALEEATASVPDGARYAHFRWAAAGACVAEVSAE
jgi:hypothetical protein